MKEIIKIKFKHRWEIFVFGWKMTRKFPGYSLRKEIKELFTSRTMEVTYK